ncbi:metal ABC transporter permease [Thermogemmatispora sp.]|uniref:metal ABC transporter permease n=1 Tax=Thermogemmatispora sp. TaxID=1968838 RepID=UPI001DECE294|nr:metal ABC transporter permease [Thermogemmatispora sp.]MBX5449669.1 metal ABC transporter permease [Thermogemmatispora sp.]
MNIGLLWQHEFVQNAFLAGGCVAIAAALVGYFLVLRAQTFAGEALTDIGFTGATGAALLGLSPLPGMLILSLLAALAIGLLGERLRGRDIEIGMVLSFALGLGVLFLSLYATSSGSHATAGVGILFGSILSVSRGDVWLSLACALGCSLALLILYRPLLFASTDPEVAAARGVPVRLLSVLFLLLLALATAISVLVIGVLLVFALLVAPAAAAERLSPSPAGALLLAVLFALGSTWGGLLIAFLGPGQHLPASFCIATLATGCYAGATLGLHLRRRHLSQRPAQPPHPCKGRRTAA